MDPGPPDPKRPRVMTTGPSPWSAPSSHHHGVSRSLLNPNPSPTTAQAPHHTPTSGPYHQHSPHLPSPHQPQPPHHFARLPGPGETHSHPLPPPPPPPPPTNAQTPIDDRRHHEPERYPSIHDHRQPPHSPAPAPYPGYSPRDHIEKPGLPEDNTLPQIRRPLSTDAMTPATPHSALPPQPYGDEKRHISFDNGPPQQPPMYRQQNYAPQPPMPHGQPPYEYQQHPYPGSHDGPPYAIQIAPASGKRKAQRASQACESCRALKAKCDEMKPCKGCKEKKQECVYREAAPKQQDKVQADILETILQMRSDFQSFNDRISRMETTLKNVVPSALAQAGMMLHDEDNRPVSVDSPAPAAEEVYTSSPGETMPGGPAAPIDTEEARNIARKMQVDEEKEVEPGPLVRPGAPTIPPNHTTPAALLLKWPPIYRLTKRHMNPELIRYIDEFPIRNEEKRGILRLWGRGEGYDGSRMDREALQDLGALEIHEDYFESGAPSPSDCWGSINGSPGPDGKPHSLPQHLDFTEQTVWLYVQSFNDHIQNMHPLIIPMELNAMVKVFIDSIHMNGKKQSTGNPGVAKFVETTGSKRKRSRSPAADAPESHFVKTKPAFQRSINNALVLLVLALGKICICADDRIPEPAPVTPATPLNTVTETPPGGGGVSHSRNGYQPPHSPTQTSPPSYSSYSGPYPQSPKDGSSSSRRSSMPTSGRIPAFSASAANIERNMDRIPGLDYFAYATDILGGQMGGFSIRHVHAHILAGLYYGQLGRVIESFAHIKQASWALQTKMRPSMDRFRKLQQNQTNNRNKEQIKDKLDNLLVFAFWSILQLESDIIAELPLPQSHILAFEEMMPYPSINLAKEWNFDDHVLQSYLAQLYLRKHLNQIHNVLYNPENPRPVQRLLEGDEILDTIEHALDMQFIPPEFKFEHDDPPASDILSARLRAKYWGAHVITFRPFIKQIIEYNFESMNGSSTDVSMTGVSPDGRSPGGMPNEHTIEYARKGIRALIESTSAFHGIGKGRFIVTNIFGTAHAQWGNLLTLTASFKDPILNRFIPEDRLQSLFAKTIAFFKVVAVPSSALEVDLRILEGLQQELWGNQPYSLLPGGVSPLIDDLSHRMSVESQARIKMQDAADQYYHNQQHQQQQQQQQQPPPPQQQHHQQQQQHLSPSFPTPPLSNGSYSTPAPPKGVPPMADNAPPHQMVANPPPYSNMHAPATPVDMKPHLGRSPLPVGPTHHQQHHPQIKTEGGVHAGNILPPMQR